MMNLISQKELANRLGVAESTVKQWTKDGKLPSAHRISRKCVRWEASEIEAWILAGCPDALEWAVNRPSRTIQPIGGEVYAVS